MTYSEADIRDAVTQSAFTAGVMLKKQRKVLSVAWPSEDHLTAKVQGSQRHPYTQEITFDSDEGGTLIDGVCTCPVGYNCKHIAAALLQALASPRPKPLSAEAQMALRMERLLDTRGSANQASTRPDGLRSDIAEWLSGLDLAEATADESYPPNLFQRLIYVLTPFVRSGRMESLAVRPMSARMRKNGQFSDSGRPYPVERATSGQEAKFLRPADIRILGDLSRLRKEGYGGDLSLRYDPEGRILEAILATGRARWLTLNGAVLDAGAPVTGRIAWSLREGAEMRPTIEVDSGLVVLAATPPVYVDVAGGKVGPIETGLAPKLAAALVDAPPIAADQVARVSQAMERRGPRLAQVRPPEPRPPRVVEEPPVPMLRLFKGRVPIVGVVPSPYYGYASLPPEEDAAIARVSFRYGDVAVDLREARTALTRLHDGGLLEIRRDREAERTHLSTLLSLGFIPIGETRPAAAQRDVAKDFELKGDAMVWFEAMYHDIPTLTARGWVVEVAPDFPFRVLRAEGEVSAELHEGSGIDWLELDLGVLIDGERIDLIGPLVAIISTDGFDPALLQQRGGAGPAPDEPLYVPLGDGRVLAIAAARLAPLVTAIHELFNGGNLQGGRVRLSAVDAASLAAFEDATREAGLAWRGGEKLRAMGRKLSDSGGIPRVAPPASFQASLRPYQADGVSWLAFLRDVGFGGILADDMGLGKTVQTLAFIAIEKAAGRLDRPALVVAPTSLMSNWRTEAERFAPDLRVLTLQGLDRKERFAEIPDSDLVLTTYPLISRDHEVLTAQPWHLLILDEAQTIKNPDATTTKLVLGLEARHRFCLSGTPLENHLGELWSLFSFAVPGLLGDRTDFTRHWRTPIEKQGNASRAAVLARRVRPFMLRRTKEQVATDLPPKTEIVERIEFQTAQRDIYEAIRLTMHQKVRDAIAQKGFNRSRIIILDALLKLRQVCCDPRLLKLATKGAARAGSAKLERLDEMLTELVAEKRRIIVFSQFTSMLALIRPRLDAAGLTSSLLTGDTIDRAGEIRRFQEGETPVFLVSLKAGGTGLNLTAADTVILYDPWWNPAVEEQAIDRAHRIGQDKPVFVHKLVAVGTIEEKMETLKQKKRALAESLFDQDGAPTLAMTESDLDMLFAAE